MVNPPPFNWAQTPKIEFGVGSIKSLARACSPYGKKVLVLTGKSSFISSPNWKRLEDIFRQEKLTFSHATVEGEPSPELIDKIVDAYKDDKLNCVVSIGGGSVLDAGKAVSAMLCHSEPAKSYLEGIGNKKPKAKKLPFIAVPTTAGTGSEATKNAVLSEVGPTGFKKSLRHDAYIPNVALIDPELMLSCPPELTASSGMDAFTQLLEAYVSTQWSGITDALAWEGLQHLAKGLEVAYKNGSDLQGRTHMAYAALLSGMALANAGLGLVHGFASSVGGRIKIPHGMLCGTLMGITNRITLKKLLDENPHSEVVKKYAAVGQLFSQEENRFGIYYANALIDLMEEYTYDFSLSRLSKFGMREEDIPSIVANTRQKNHPITLSEGEMQQILKARL